MSSMLIGWRESAAGQLCMTPPFPPCTQCFNQSFGNHERMCVHLRPVNNNHSCYSGLVNTPSALFVIDQETTVKYVFFPNRKRVSFLLQLSKQRITNPSCKLFACFSVSRTHFKIDSFIREKVVKNFLSEQVTALPVEPN